MTSRANFAGFFTCFNPATAPAFLVAPFMTDASNSTSPISLKTAPLPALK